MNIVQKLTIRNLKMNKRRTIVTIIGVLISTAMIVAVSSFAFSVYDFIVRNETYSAGSWHNRFNGVEYEKTPILEDYSGIKDYAFSRGDGYAFLDDGKNMYKPYLYVEEFDQKAFEMYPIHLVEGRLPQNSSELVISDHVISNGRVAYKVGDTLTLQLGKRMLDSGEELNQMNPLQTDEEGTTVYEKLVPDHTRTFTIVGIIERPGTENYSAPGYSAFTVLDPASLTPQSKVDVSVQLTNTKDFFTRMGKLAQDLGMETESYGAEVVYGGRGQGEEIIYDGMQNMSVLRYYGLTATNGEKTTLIGISAILMLLIMTGSVSFIYNSFAISMAERSKQLGMLASVGATRRQKRSSVVFEAVLISCIGIPLGIICGIVGIGITVACTGSMLQQVFGFPVPFKLVVSFWAILAAILVSALTVALSIYVPSKRAARITPIEAIRMTGDVKLKAKTVRTMKLTRKIFGFEGELALKNLKRNSRRYRTTVFSIVISILLYLSVSSFAGYTVTASEEYTARPNYEMRVYAYGSQGDNVGDELFEDIQELEGIEQISLITTRSGFLAVPEEKLSSEVPREKIEENFYTESLKEEIIPGCLNYPTNLIRLNREEFERYVAQIGEDMSKYTDKQHPAAILVNRGKYYDGNGKAHNVKLLDPSLQGELSFALEDHTGELVVQEAKLSIGAMTDQIPMGSFADGVGYLNCILLDEVYDAMMPSDIENYVSGRSQEIFIKTQTPDQLEEKINDMLDTSSYHGGVYNYEKDIRQQEQLRIVVFVFVYGFIILISAICIANIFNTLTTGMAMREKELAMLRSVGMTPKSFWRMIRFESLFYGIKALLYGLPLSLLINVLIYRQMVGSQDIHFTIPWLSIVTVVVVIFLVLFLTMWLACGKLRRKNIIDALRQDSI